MTRLLNQARNNVVASGATALAIVLAVMLIGCGKESPPTPPATLPQSPVPPPPAAETPAPGPTAAAPMPADATRAETTGRVLASEKDYLLQIVNTTHPVVTSSWALAPVPIAAQPEVPPGVYTITGASLALRGGMGDGNYGGSYAGGSTIASGSRQLVMVNSAGVIHPFPDRPFIPTSGIGMPGYGGITPPPPPMFPTYSSAGTERQTRLIYTSLRSGEVLLLADGVRRIPANPLFPRTKESSSNLITPGAVFRAAYESPTIIAGLARDGQHLCVVMLQGKTAELAIYALPGGGAIDRVTIQAEGARAAAEKVRVVSAQPALPATAEQANMLDSFAPGPIHLRGQMVEVYGVEMELP